MPEPLVMWTVYERPTDYPNEWVARRFLGEEPTAELERADTLEELQERLSAKGLVWMDRHANDDPKIVGVWL
jgi:hypothetical protein